MKTKKQQNSNLSSKLKDVFTDLSVDIFGYEKMVSKNIIKRTNYISHRIKIPTELLFIRIFQVEHQIKSFLYEREKPISTIATEDLAYFFLDEQTAAITNIKNKIAFSIKQYLKDFAEANRIDENSVRIWIQVKEKKVYVRAFQGEEFIKQIPLNTLIKYFK